MSYTPTTWQSGDIVTAEKLNKLEQGLADIGGGDPFVITVTPTAQDLSGTMDKTPAQILEAYESGKEIKIKVPSSAHDFSVITPSSIDYGEAHDGFPGYASVVAICMWHNGNDYLLVQATTSTSDSTYSTSLFQLNVPNASGVSF